MTKVAVGAFSGGNDASQWLLFVGATTTTPLAQVKTFSWTQDVVTDEQMRVSASATEYTDKGIKVSGVLELWHSSTLAEQSSVGGLSLAADDTPITFIAVYHTAEATSGTVVKTYTFTNFRITQNAGGPREGGSSGYAAYTWRSTLLTVT